MQVANEPNQQRADRGDICKQKVVLQGQRRFWISPGGLEVIVAKYGQVYTCLTRNFELNVMVRSIFSFELLFFLLIPVKAF